MKMFFDHIEQAPADPIFGLLDAFAADPRKEKVNLMVGIYKDNHLKAELFPSVRRAKELIETQDLMADYLPIDGYPFMTKLLSPVVFGEKAWDRDSERIYVAQTVGGTAALRVGAELLLKEVGKMVCIPNHTWPNHRLVFERAGCKVETYPYYSHEKKGFDLDSMLQFLDKLPSKTIILMHACCHNPTGCDPTLQEWIAISEKIQQKQLFPFFDLAYQGLGEGLDQDSSAIRIFFERGHEMIVAYSCSKNFSLYCQRVGAFFVVAKDKENRGKIASQVKRIIRALYSNPPAHGTRIVAEILGNLELKELWMDDLQAARQRITSTRENLIRRLTVNKGCLDFSFLKKHKGMFSFLDLDKEQVRMMRDEFAIYMTDYGRISIAGLSSENIDYVVEGLLAVCGER